MAVVHLPTSLVALFPGAPRRVELEASTVDELVDALDARWPGMRERLCDSSAHIREFVHIYVNGERASLDAALPEGAMVHVIPAMAGGQTTAWTTALASVRWPGVEDRPGIRAVAGGRRRP